MQINIKILQIFIASCLCIVSTNTFTSLAKFYGATHLSNQNYTNLEISGSAHLTNITVTNHATIYGGAHLRNFTCSQFIAKGGIDADQAMIKNADISGSFRCNNGTFDLLTIHGSSIFDTVKIRHSLHVYGSIVASNLQCPCIEVASDKVELKNSYIDTIIVKNNDNTYYGFFNLWGLLSWGTRTSKMSEVYLDGGSVSDSIIFQGPAGRVILTNGAQVAAVQNGTIISQ